MRSSNCKQWFQTQYLSITKLCLLSAYLVNMYIGRMQFSGGVWSTYCLRNFKLHAIFANKTNSVCTICLLCFADEIANVLQDCKVLVQISTKSMQNRNLCRQHCLWPGVLAFDTRRQLFITQTSTKETNDVSLSSV